MRYRVGRLAKELHRELFISRLQTYRAERRITQANLAAALGVSRQTLSAVEQNKQEPSLRLAYLCAQYFKIPIEQIFSYVTKPSPSPRR